MTHTEKINVASILVEEEQLMSQYQASWFSYEDAKRMSLQEIKKKYSQYDY